MIRVKLEREILLGDIWCDKEAFFECYANDRNAFIEFLSEDILSVIDEAGGLSGLIKEYQWIEEIDGSKRH